MRLNGKVALVIGASRGSGKAAALELAAEGADIAIAARTERPDQSAVSGTIMQTAEEVEALGRRAVPIRVDLAQGHEIDAMYRTAIEAFGRIDILVHSVQYMGPGYLDYFKDTTVDQLEMQFRVNLLSAMHACKLVVPDMVARGGGLVILMSSAAALNKNRFLPGEGSTGLGYPVCKAGLNRFVECLEKEVRPHNVAVIAVDPGFTLAEHVREGAVGSIYQGWDIKYAHGVEVPARTIRYLSTCPDPMWYSGKLVVAEEFVREHNLVEGFDGLALPLSPADLQA
jgi:NAD(P)-dependent dehydrogenase (short-subunit alcohol dehydrogenase family)